MQTGRKFDCPLRTQSISVTRTQRIVVETLPFKISKWCNLRLTLSKTLLVPVSVQLSEECLALGVRDGGSERLASAGGRLATQQVLHIKSNFSVEETPRRGGDHSALAAVAAAAVAKSERLYFSHFHHHTSVCVRACLGASEFVQMISNRSFALLYQIIFCSC